MYERTEKLVRTLAAALCVFAAACGGCAGLRPPSVANGAPATHRIKAAPFVISTSFPIAEADPLVQELVALRSRVHRTLGLAPNSRTIEIYVFDDRQSFERFMRSNYPELPRRRAFFIAQDEREVVYAFRHEKLLEDLRHEVCHAIVHAAVGSPPLWLDEGLAEYFETPGDADGRHERHLAELRPAIQRNWRPALTRLESRTEVRQMTAADYREAWGWVYFLLHGSPQGRGVLLGYLEDSRAGTAREPLSTRLFQVASRPDTAMIAFFDRLEPATPTTVRAASDR